MRPLSITGLVFAGVWALAPPPAFAQDTTPPQIVSVQAPCGSNVVTVTFDEPVDPPTAGDYFNYTVEEPGGGMSYPSVLELLSDRSVRLLVEFSSSAGPIAEGASDQLRVEGVGDLAGNKIKPEIRSSGGAAAGSHRPPACAARNGRTAGKFRALLPKAAALSFRRASGPTAQAGRLCDPNRFRISSSTNSAKTESRNAPHLFQPGQITSRPSSGPGFPTDTSNSPRRTDFFPQPGGGGFRPRWMASSRRVSSTIGLAT